MIMNRRFARALLLTTCFMAPMSAWAQTADETAPQDEIIVSGRRAADRAALESKRDSNAQVDEVRADDVGRLPDQNVAETLRRLPGLSVANDQGEGRYLTVRGVSPNLLNVTLNGQTAAAPEPDSRQVKLDDIPSALIGAVTVSKTLTPDMDANAIAGAANIETVSAFDRAGTFGSVRGSYGRYDLGGSHPYEVDGSVGTRFGADRQFGVVLALNYSNREFIAENVQSGASWEEVNGQFLPLEQTLRRYQTHRQRYGAVANFDWRPTDDVKTYLRFLYSKYKDKESRPGFTVELDEDAITNQTATSGDFTGADGARALRSREEDSDTFTASLGGEFNLGPNWLRVEGSFTRANKRDPHRDEWKFESEDIGGSYDLSESMPLFSPDASAFDPANYEFHETSYEHRKAREDLYQTRADFRTPIAVGDDSSIQVGVKYTKRHKTNEIDSRIYGDYSDDLTMDQVLGSPVSGIYNGRYPFGPTISRAAADGFFDAHSGDFELDEEGTVGDSLAGDYRINEKIFAAYAMATFKAGNFTAIPGVRMEKTKSDYAAKAVLDSSTIADLSKGFDSFGSQSYTDWFPGLNLRWNATRSLVLRAAVTRAIGRPNYEQLAPTVSVNTGDNEVTMGNPNLLPLKSTNYDIAAEYYLGRSGIISIAGFYKTISNPIYSSTVEQSGTFAGRDLVDAQVTLPVNADSAFVKGIEINAQTELSFLPSPLNGFSVGGSITFVKSRAKGIPGRDGERLPLANQSNRVASAYLSYEKGGLSARIAYTYRSAYLLEPGEDTDNDTYVGAFNQWDARIGYDVVKNVTLFVEGSNLNDEPYRVYQGIPSRIDEVERYGLSVKGGVQFKF